MRTNIKIKRKIQKLLDEDDREILFESERLINERLTNNNNKNKHICKLEELKTKQNRELNIKFNKEWFINKTKTDIPTNIQWILSLGPKHSLPNTNKDIPLFKCIAEGEDCIQTLPNKEKQEDARVKLVSLIDNHLQKSTNNQRDRLIIDTVGQSKQFLDNNKDILILSSDKGNKTVAMEKKDYETKMKEMLWDMCTYKRLNKDPTSSMQTKNNLLVEKLHNKNLITTNEKNKLTIRTANAPRIYGLPKIHKSGTPLRPICSSINSPSYGLCKFLINILKHLTNTSKYNVRDAIDFKARIQNTLIADDEILISFDVVSLFPSIPINLALKTIEEKWNILEEHTNIPKELFLELLTFCIKESRYFKYEDKVYEQRKGMPMGSPASPVISDVVMEKLLDVSIEKMNTKPRILTKYVDDIFAIVKKDAITDTLNTLNSFHSQIQFTMEKENNNRLPYLDVTIIRQGNLLKLDWYQKPTASGRLINFYSKHPKRVIINTATNFIRRVLNISDKEYHKTNINKIKDILTMNDFPYKTINDLIKKTKNYIPKDEPPKIYKGITYIPGLSERIKGSNIYDTDKFNLAPKTNNTLNKLFHNTKSKLKKEEKSNVIYKIECDGDGSNICPKVYVGTTKTKLKTRLSSHKSDLKALDKPLEQKTALAAHCAQNNHKPNFNTVKILQEETNYSRRFTLEMLHIIDVPAQKRLNYKQDVERCAHIYRHLVNKHRRSEQK